MPGGHELGAFANATTAACDGDDSVPDGVISFRSTLRCSSFFPSSVHNDFAPSPRTFLCTYNKLKMTGRIRLAPSDSKWNIHPLATRLQCSLDDSPRDQAEKKYDQWCADGCTMVSI